MNFWPLTRELSKLRNVAKIWVEHWKKLKVCKRYPILKRNKNLPKKVNRSSNNRKNRSPKLYNLNL